MMSSQYDAAGGAAILATLLALRARRKRQTAMSAKPAKAELVYSCAVVRHGARGPTRKALYLACGETPEQYALRKSNDDIAAETDHPATPAARVWRPDEPEALTEVGRAQLRRVGEWFRQRYVPDHGLEPALQRAERIKMRVSDRPRVVASADAFSLGFGAHSINRQPYSTRGDADRVFRSWQGKSYNDAVDVLRKGPAFHEYGKAQAAVLDRTVCEVAGNWVRAADRGTQLNYATYVNELLECEKYAGKDLLPGSLSSKLSSDAKKELRGLAKHCFDLRFFGSMGKRFGKEIGGDLLAEIQQDVVQALEGTGPQLAAYMGHDYTILALLAALGYERHPPEITGFGAFVVLQWWRLKKGDLDSDPKEEKLLLKVMLYSDPFPDSFTHKNGIEVGEPLVSECIC